MMSNLKQTAIYAEVIYKIYEPNSNQKSVIDTKNLKIKYNTKESH